MFTGIVEELGTVRAIDVNATGRRLEIAATRVLEDVQIGASIAVNGVCLTVVEHGLDWWKADAVEETINRSSLGSLTPGARVNLERPVRLADRLDGHLVQGHVDAVATVAQIEPLADGSTHFRFEVPADLTRYIVEKGSVTVDGISLTVVEVTPTTFGVAVIPHTLAVTNLGSKQLGSAVNIEVDVMAKYVEKLLAYRA
jgi:riboflavin synthase